MSILKQVARENLLRFVNEFVGAADLSLFTMTAVNTILSISKETPPKLPDRVKDTAWWSNGYVNWNEEEQERILWNW